MNVKLLKLSINSFKGIKTFQADFAGGHAVIKGANGTGKTTVYDAYLWLLFSKDSTGRKDFELRPLDKANQPIKGLVLAVEAELSFDGVRHVLRKEHHEKIVKDQLRGYETLCYIDEVPKKVGEYAAWIAELIPEDTFKMLTSLRHFSQALHWKDRRAVLLDIAGEIGTPGGFDELLAALNGRTVDEYRKVLADQKKRLVKDRDEINPRIDELQRGLDGYAGQEAPDLDSKRQAVAAEITQLDSQRQELLGKESERQAAYTRLNALKAEKTQRESELLNDTSNIKHLLDAKAKIVEGVAEREQAVVAAKNARTLKDSEVRTKNTELQAEQRTLAGVQEEYKAAEKKPLDGDCYACGQKLPQDKMDEVAKKRTAKLNEITVAGNAAFERVTGCRNAIEALAHECQNLQEKVGQAELKLVEAEQYRDEKLTHIENQIKHNPKKPPEQDAIWQRIDRDIATVETGIGEPVGEQLTASEQSRTAKQTELAGLTQALAQADRMIKDKARIGELEQQEKTLAQKIADIEKQVADIEKYKATESAMVEAAVNGRFKHVEFKLFSQLLNGGMEDCCEATLNGVPYLDMSCGQKIIVGIDIINVLSEHYGLSVPLFIDNAESLTLPVESTSQTIELYTQRDIQKMTVEQTEQRTAAA